MSTKNYPLLSLDLFTFEAWADITNYQLSLKTIFHFILIGIYAENH